MLYSSLIEDRFRLVGQIYHKIIVMSKGRTIGESGHTDRLITFDEDAGVDLYIFG